MPMVRPRRSCGRARRFVLAQRDHRQRAALVHRGEGGDWGRRRRREDGEGRQVPEAEIGLAAADQAQRLERAGAGADRGDLDALRGEEAAVARDEEHRVIAARDPVELDG